MRYTIECLLANSVCFKHTLHGIAHFIILNANCFFFNPFLIPKCDHHQMSPCNMNTLQNTLVIRIRDMITQDESN